MSAAPVYSLSAVDDPPDPELVRIRDLIYQEAGIFHPDTKLRLLFDRCAQRMKELKASSLREYFEHLTLKPTRQAELIALLNEIRLVKRASFAANLSSTPCGRSSCLKSSPRKQGFPFADYEFGVRVAPPVKSLTP
jgi:hypothetical protein